MLQYHFNPHLFKAYDIRGKVCASEINEEVAFFLGVSLGKLIENGKVCVGFDARSHSKILAQSFIKGLTEMGIDVYDVSLIPSPISYFASYFLDVKASVIITGSHNPPEYNGFKITFKESGFSEKDLLKIASEGVQISSVKGSILKKDLTENYIESVLKNLEFGSKKLRIGIDGMNGSGGLILQKICAKLPFDFVFQNANSSGDFSEFLPEPSLSSNVSLLQNFLEKEKLDYVFAFDGDADRVLFISNSKVWYGDDITLLFASELLPFHKNGKVIFDVKSSLILEMEIEKLGGIGVIFKTGHSLIKQKLQAEKALLAGEFSGHIYINDGKFFPFDDGIYSFLRILEIISKKNLPEFQKTFRTGEIKLKIKEKDKFIENVEEVFMLKNPSKIIKIDGTKFYFHNNTASFLIRKSNTEDVIIVMVEALEKKDFEELQSAFFHSTDLINS